MYEIHNRGDSTEMLIYEDIGEGFFGGVSSRQVLDDLAGISTPNINVRINSPGGDVFEGIAIYNALRRHDSRIVVDVDALAASAASLIAMAGDTVRISDNSMMMIHNPYTIAGGDAREMRRVADLLDKVGENVVSIYHDKTPDLNPSQIQDMLDAETWLTASEAVEMGFADEVTAGLSVAAAAFKPDRFQHTPRRFELAHSLRAESDIAAPPEWRDADMCRRTANLLERVEADPVAAEVVRGWRRAAAGRRLELTKLRTPTKN